ncbi:MAG: hypothetical protein LKI59_08155 [Bacteroidales bacterium]|jgi:hypothetical protein|nr:hypothetical protein [Bacteroidales bacterium]
MYPFSDSGGFPFTLRVIFRYVFVESVFFTKTLSYKLEAYCFVDDPMQASAMDSLLKSVCQVRYQKLTSDNPRFAVVAVIQDLLEVLRQGREAMRQGQLSRTPCRPALKTKMISWIVVAP